VQEISGNNVSNMQMMCEAVNSYLLWSVTGVHTVSFADAFTDRLTTSLWLRLSMLPNMPQIQNWALKVICMPCFAD